MRHLRSLAVFAAVTAFNESAADVALAAKMTDCSLVVDGSAEPPGDRIDCEVAFADGESSVIVEVRGYLVPDSPSARVSFIHSTDPALRASDGSLRIRLPLEAPAKAHGAQRSIVIPYAAMDVPTGTHQLGYEVALVVGDRIVWSQPLPLTLVTIGNEARTEIQPRPIRQSTEHTEEVKRVAIGGNRSGREVEERPVRLRSTQPSPSFDERSDARIERGFDRSTLGGRSSNDERLADLGDQPWSPAADVLASNERTVRFATNRASPTHAASSGSSTFLPSRAPLRYGRCRVNFPVRFHRRGRLELPTWWQSYDPERHFRVESTEFASASEFFGRQGPDDTLLFIHGFANGFEDGVMVAAQLAADVDFGGQGMAFCWPSAGVSSQEAYAQDATMARESIEDLADVLFNLSAPRSGKPSGRVHVIAHSMGNRILLEAVFRLIESGRWAAEEKRLGQVILAAPDVGAASFNNLVDNLIGSAERVTYYYYSNDAALGMSQQVNKYEPVGKFPYFERGLDTINVDGSGTDFLGHSYYSSSVKVLADLDLLLHHGFAPDRRMPPLGAKTRIYGHDHWSFLPIVASEIKAKR